MNGENNEIKSVAFAEKVANTSKKRGTAKRASKTKTGKNEAQGADPSMPLKLAADRIASLLCELSSDSSLFVTASGEAPSRRLDTKALKEFSGVLKEMSAVMMELHEDEGQGKRDAVRIEFSDETSDLGI